MLSYFQLLYDYFSLIQIISPYIIYSYLWLFPITFGFFGYFTLNYFWLFYITFGYFSLFHLKLFSAIVSFFGYYKLF